MKQSAWMIIGLLALGSAGCGAVDRDRGGPLDRLEARRECAELARARGYRDIDVEDVDRIGEFQWRVTMRARRENNRAEVTLRCVFNDRLNRATLGNPG